MSLSVRHLALTFALAVVASLAFASVMYWFEKRDLRAAQVASLRAQASHAADIIAASTWEAALDEEQQLLILQSLHKAVHSDGPEPPMIVVFGLGTEVTDPLELRFSSKDESLATQIMSNKAVDGARFGQNEAWVSFLNIKPDEARYQRVLRSIGDFLGTTWGPYRSIVAAAPIIPPASESVTGVLALEEIRPATVINWSEFGVKVGIGLLASLLPAALMGFRFASQLGKEIHKVSEGATQVREGRYEYRIEALRNDEIGELQRGFNLLAEHLERARTTNEDALREVLSSKKEAEVATDAKSDFLANMSHEIRTPMNGIIGTTSLLLEAEPSDQQRELLHIIRASGDSLLHIINDVLDYSKLESAKMVLDETPMETRPLIEEISDMFAFNAAERGLELIHFLDSSVPACVYADRERLKQVLVNLVGNAIKFTEGGEIVIQSIVVAGDIGPRLQFSIRDSGIGIDTQQLDNIFSAFQQADVSTTRKYGGSGLGLAISRKLVRLMGGELKVESQPGVGSTFYFDLPLRLVPERTAPPEPAECLAALKGHNIAVVANSLSVGELAAMMLNHWGASAQAIPGLGADIYQQLEVLRPSMIVCDTTGHPPAAIASFAHTLNQQQVPTLLLNRIGQESILRAAQLPPGPLLQETSKPIKSGEFLQAAANIASGGQLGSQLNGQGREGRPEEFANRYPGRILIVEDQPMNQKIVSMMLEKLGYQVDITNNGREGADAVNGAQGTYDLVFMDLMMPVLGGIDCAKEIRGNFLLPRQPLIIAMTGHALTGVREECKAAGMDDFLTKPVSIDDLRGAIEKTYVRLQAA